MGAAGRLRAAVGFLTRIPVGRVDAADGALTRAGGWFPLVGAVVAGVGIAAWWAGTHALGPAVGAVLSVLATVVVTGALHEDGFADTVDGWWGGADRTRRLEIMRDSRIGTYGVLALAGELLLRVALLLPFGAGDLADVARILVAGHVLGRAAALLLAASTPSARSDGLGARLQRLRPGGMVLAGLTVVIALVACAGWWAPVVAGAALSAVSAVRLLAMRRIGGVTGDVFGAGVVVTNVVVAATVVGLARQGLL